MIKQIINWTAGGFFRTLGKLLLFIIIGLILGYFISIKNIRLPLISFGKVYAVTDEAFSSAESRVFVDQQGTETYLSWHDIPYTQSVSYPVTQMQYRLKATNGFRKDNTYRFKVSYLPSPDALYAVGIWFSDGTSSLDASCTGFVKESNGYYANTCTISPLVDLSSSQAIYVRLVFQPGYVNSVRSWVGTFVESQGVASTIENQTIDITNAIDSTAINIINNQNENTQAIIDSNKSCEYIDSNSIINMGQLSFSNGQPVSSNDFGYTDFYKVNNNTEITILTNWSNAVICYYSPNKTFKSCVSANQSVNSLINIPSDTGYIRFSIWKNGNKPTYNICKNGSQAIIDSLTDTDTTQQENEFDEMIDDLQFSSEGAIETIIMLPINLIASIINPSNQNLCFTLNNKQVCFPNGSIIWGRSGCSSSWFGCPDFSAFRTFFQLVGEGFIIWYLLKRIVYTFEDITDPTKSTTEVMKL